MISFSGGHINPAVSLAMCVTGRLKWIKLPVYILAQHLGAFIGAVAVFSVNYGEYKVDAPNGKLEGLSGPTTSMSPKQVQKSSHTVCIVGLGLESQRRKQPLSNQSRTSVCLTCS